MSKPQISARPGTKSFTQKVNERREELESLADLENTAGAMARIFLAIADNRDPSRADCEEAGLMTLYELATENTS